MSDEEAFQKALDANPEDHQTRLVFADWLQEREDLRAEGYHALGVRARHFFVSGKIWWLGNAEQTALAEAVAGNPEYVHRHGILPQDWFRVVEGGEEHLGCWWKFDNRRDAEDAAALAFAKLPPERRAKLLAGVK